MNEPEFTSGITYNLCLGFLSAHWLYSFACFEMDFEIFTTGWALSLIALNPHSSQAKLTAVDSPCPFRLFSRNDTVLTDALAGKRKRGEKIVSKEPCFINVNTVTGQSDQSPSSMHNYYSTTRKRHIKSRDGEGERSRQVQWGEQRWGNEAPLSLSSAIRHPRSQQKMTLPFSPPPLPLWPNCLRLSISYSNPILHPPIISVFKSLPIHKGD